MKANLAGWCGNGILVRLEHARCNCSVQYYVQDCVQEPLLSPKVVTVLFCGSGCCMGCGRVPSYVRCYVPGPSAELALGRVVSCRVES